MELYAILSWLSVNASLSYAPACCGASYGSRQPGCPAEIPPSWLPQSDNESPRKAWGGKDTGKAPDDRHPGRVALEEAGGRITGRTARRAPTTHPHPWHPSIPSSQQGGG